MSENYENKEVYQPIIVTDYDSFFKNLQEAYKQIKSVTTFIGSFDNPDTIDKFFDTFEVKPLDVDGRPIGVEIGYSVNPKKVVQPKTKPKKTGGSSKPSLDFKI